MHRLFQSWTAFAAQSREDRAEDEARRARQASLPRAPVTRSQTCTRPP